MANIDKIVPAKRNIPFSPPDISELEIAEVAEALRSGWITTEALLESAKLYGKSPYGQHLTRVADDRVRHLK